MRGDFSRWQFRSVDNFNGILPQQGKLLIDADGLAQTRIANYWNQTAARDWVGAVAAVPADEPASFEISDAILNADGTVTLTLGAGHVWADGLLVQIGGGPATVKRKATWLEPPVVPNAGGAPAANTEDVVVLEVWQEGIHGYQMPDALIEPALGGPDTAERLHTATAFRLARLAPGQSCKSLTFSNAGTGKLTATLQPVTVIPGDCPIPVGGGYSGFEHSLYRIEIADVPDGSPSLFKWSRENGGLAGRGTFNPGPNTIAINANLVAITTNGNSTFYAEIEQWDATRGNWQVLCGGNVTLANDTLTFTGAGPAFGSLPAAQTNVFFRLWEGIDSVSDYPIQANPAQLESGIFLQFDPDGPGVYRPRDYWLFPVRAGGISNPQTLINARPPEGIVYHRVPLAEIVWAAPGKVSEIEDCRATITPLTAARGCCTAQVGDGLTTFAQFTSIQAAVDSLPAEGGEVCVLAGRYFESIQISKSNVSIHGCGHRTRIASPSYGPAKGANTGAVVVVANCSDIHLHSFVVEAADGDIGIQLAGASGQPASINLPTDSSASISSIAMNDLVVVSSDQRAISIERSFDVKLERSLIAQRSGLSAAAAIYASGSEIWIEGNWVGPFAAADMPEVVAADVSSNAFLASGAAPMPAPCGIQIAGVTDRVHIRSNEIAGGNGNGITLGELILLDGNGILVNGYVGYNPGGGKVNPCANGGFYFPKTIVYGGQTVTIAASGTLSNLQIENNLISNMGLCGIGPIGFFSLTDAQEIVSVNGLRIARNQILSCLSRTLVQYTNADSSSLGYGGICLPDVTAVCIQDNLILNTGASLADPVCGIFVLYGAGIEISRNQVVDTRNWANADAAKLSGFRAGIALVLVTPQDAPGAAFGAWNNISGFYHSSSGLYAHGAPALVIQDNVVDIPVGLSLSAAGLGAFAIENNNFSTGGIQGDLLTLARSILIFNFGTMLEYPTPVSTAAEILALFAAMNSGATLSEAFQTVLGGTATILGTIAPGPVNFTGNRCAMHQNYEATAATASIVIYTFDDLGFHNNQCWMAAGRREVDCGAMLLGATVRATGCRFQEAPGTVFYSALTFGLMNITSLNEGTHAFAPVGPLSVTANNLVW